MKIVPNEFFFFLQYYACSLFFESSCELFRDSNNLDERFQFLGHLGMICAELALLKQNLLVHELHGSIDGRD